MVSSPYRIRSRSVVLAILLAFVVSACSIRTIAINEIGDALASGSGTFASDDDPDLVGDALPFSLKLIESLLAESPRHRGLLLTAASGFTQYSYGWVHLPSDELATTDFAASRDEIGRARRLYLRARDYGLRAIDPAATDLRQSLIHDSESALAGTTRRDVPALYWTAASWALAISISKNDPDLVADLSIVDSLIRRAVALDASWNDGALDTLLVTWEMARPSAGRDAEEKARAHFERAVSLSRGLLAAPYVSLAESVSLENQNREEFVELMNAALAIDPDAKPDTRMQNLISQRRARWQLARIEDLFLDSAESEVNQ